MIHSQLFSVIGLYRRAYTNHVIHAVNNASEIKAVRILYVCQTSTVDQLYPMSDGETQHIMNEAKVNISQITVKNTLPFVIGCRSSIFFLRNPRIKNRTANRQKTIVTDDKAMSNSWLPLILYDCGRLPSSISLTFRTRLILVFAPLVNRQRAVCSFGNMNTSVAKLGLPPACSIIVWSAFTDHPAA